MFKKLFLVIILFICISTPAMSQYDNMVGNIEQNYYNSFRIKQLLNQAENFIEQGKMHYEICNYNESIVLFKKAKFILDELRSGNSYLVVDYNNKDLIVKTRMLWILSVQWYGKSWAKLMDKEVIQNKLVLRNW